jgi:general secretion pathway protein D
VPHINDSNEVRLEIDEEISERGRHRGRSSGGDHQPRTAKTVVVVRDQQTVVIGGLIRDSDTNSETRIPILGDIPILGALFRNTTRSTQKSNLLLFLTPYVIRDQSDLRRIFERKMRERQEFLDRYFVFGGTTTSRRIDYSRTNGLVERSARTSASCEAARSSPKLPPECRAAAGAAAARASGIFRVEARHWPDIMYIGARRAPTRLGRASLPAPPPRPDAAPMPAVVPAPPLPAPSGREPRVNLEHHRRCPGQ